MQDLADTTARTEVGLQFPRRERAALGAGAMPTSVTTFDVDTLLETSWASAATTSRARPNVLIHCPAASTASLMGRLRAWAIPPVAVCDVGEDGLALPRNPGGTVLVHDVAALSVPQQIDMYDWISLHAGQTHVIAITSVPLAPRVENGQFLQALFYRLNVLQTRVVGE